MKKVDINISSTGFPSQFVSDSKKASDEFGLQIGQAIQYEWFKKDGNGCRFYSQWGDFHRLRLYARGEQSVGKYKNELAIDGDLSYLNLDWTPVPILPKFVDIVVNGMQSREFVPKAFAQDAMSQSKRSKYQQMVEGQMIAKPLLDIIQNKTGVNPFTVNPDELPNSDEELKLYMQLNYKPAIEIAEEEAISTLFESNRYEEIRKRLDYDMTVLGIACAKHEFLMGDGVSIKYVDPANIVYSYTEDPNFRDCFYWGEIKTVYKRKVKDNGNVSMIEKDDSFNPPIEMQEEGNFTKESKTIDVWYEGVMVMGTNILLQWKMMENMVRPQSATQHAIPNYVCAAPRIY